jgi:hypothetical protein
MSMDKSENPFPPNLLLNSAGVNIIKLHLTVVSKIGIMRQAVTYPQMLDLSEKS